MINDAGFETQPWLKSIKERREEIEGALRSKKKIALMLYPSPDGSTFRYRGYNVYQATKESKEWQLIYFFLSEIKEIHRTLPKINLLILSRINHWSPEIDQLTNLAHIHGISVVNDLDDCICGTKHIKEFFNLTSPDRVDWEYWIKTSAHFELVSYNTDGFLVTNDYLGEVLSTTHDNKPYQVIPNFLNTEQIEFSEGLKKITDSSCFTLGYFSGSNTHASDLGEIYPEIIQLLHEHPKIRLHIVGQMELPKSAKDYLGNGQIITSSIVDFLELQRLISMVDINLAPLVDSTFTNCKSDLKFFEAALVHTPTIASPTYAFRRAIVDGKNGFLCRPGEWYDKILELYRDRELLDRVAAVAYDYCLKKYSPTAMLPLIESALNNCERYDH